MNLVRYSKEYIDGVESFLEFAYSYGDLQGEEIQCPCAKYCNIRWTGRNVVYDHLICYGFVKGYTRWINHEEWDIKLNVDDDMDYSRDDIDGLLNDQFRDAAQAEGVYDGPNEDAKKFYNLVEEASQELYPGCTGFSKLSFTLRLYLLKCLHGWSNESFTFLLELLKEAMLELNIPPSNNKTKSMVKNLELDYVKIDACPNDCMLFRNDHKDDEFCHTCGASRYIKSPEVDNGKLRHPADGLAWKYFDRLHPDFALDCRNVRLGLSSDGFNPFRTMSISHSICLVMLMVYNLPPWMCMKSEYSILPLLIPGPRSHGNDIDIYLQPLIDELKLLWDYGVETYDASRNQTFQMRAALIWTLNDFHAYAMLSGWSTKGKFACPCCDYVTNSRYLKHSRKMCYMDHRVFLPMDHPWRSNKRSFNGKTEFRPPPPFVKGTDVLNSLHDFENVFGKKRKRSNEGPWKKRCSQEKPFVLGSQVHQCCYVQDPYDQDRHYVRKTVLRDLFNMGDEVEYNLPQSYENEPSKHLMGPSIPKDYGEVLLTRIDVPETIIDVPSEEFVTQQLEVEYEEEFEDEFADEFEDELENEYEDEFEDEYEDKSAEEFEGDAP
ncbi:hypothetical protein MTR67_011627 [Solanum verrucosum]|uniref:Transposase-associated domain-containing protein n=1 Tax=Solanum verrucosum TaxID=315347 RepID=A0AAF0Q8E9_SOLVR|nr:hypothetical protein MTR67_011627 [Solanum verrucosum]